MRVLILSLFALSACTLSAPPCGDLCVEDTADDTALEADTDTDCDTDTDTDTDADADTDSDTDTDPGQDPVRYLTVNVASQDGDVIPAMQFNYCMRENEDDPTDCTNWVEPGQTVFDADHIQWSTDEVDAWTDGIVRFNVSYFLDESDVDRDEDSVVTGLDDDASSDSWLCYGSSSLELTADVDLELDGVFYGSEYVGVTAYETGCSAYVKIVDGVLVALR